MTDGISQLSLDFSGNSKSAYRGESVVNRVHPEWGIGKIQASQNGQMQIWFPQAEKEISESEENPDYIILGPYPQPLEEWEVSSGSMELGLSAQELKLTHAYDKLSALSNSRTRLLPHQIESTYIVVNSLKPRFILADEVGLGKTVEAALVMKELIFRRGYKKVLIIAPSPLLIQWQQEMKNKFNEDFEIITRRNFVGKPDLHWKKFRKLITSVDFIKNPVYAEEILKTKWDIVVFDEAHRLRRDYHKVTRSYLFAEKISKKCECLLLLSATPFRGKLEELYYLVHLIDPNVLGSYHAFVQDYILGNKTDLKEKISKVLLRRRKVEVGGFTKRFAKTVKIELSPAERQFYDETTDYVRREYNIAMKSANRAVGFVMIVFQKLLDSSVFALLSALNKRKFMLETKFHHLKQLENTLDEWDLDETENVEDFISDLDESNQPDLASMRRELLSLNRLIMLGKKIKEDRKTQKLKETLQKLKKEGSNKFIIFTQFRSTQDYLASVLEDFRVTLFHGSLSADAKERAILEFKNETEILICTEAGGEGRNLQFGNVLINYDLPWSPLKIEQRIGRIHRFGQQKDVFIFNFASKDTVAERILEVLSQKIRLFEESIGVSDELLGAIQDELDFNSSFMKFVGGSKTKEELEMEIDAKIRIAKTGFEKLSSLVTPQFVDFNLQDYYSHTLEERKYTNSHLEEFSLQFLKRFPTEAGFALEKRDELTYKLTDVESGRTRIASFDTDLAMQNDSIEFLAFGHPLIDAIVEKSIHSAESFRKRTFHSDSYSDSIFFVFLVEFQFTLDRKELFAFEWNLKTESARYLEEIPEEIRQSRMQNVGASEFSQSQLERIYIEVLKELDKRTEKRKKELQEKTYSLFQKEEYKIQLSNENTIRQLEEKLMRQEAAFKWENKPEKKSAMNRTKNEIQKVREDYEMEMRKIKSGRKIHHTQKLFQVYISDSIQKNRESGEID